MKTINIIVMLSFLLQACGGQQPTQKDILGKWKSASGAEFIFKENGTFTAKSIPIEFGFMPSDSLKNIKFDGIGKWKIRKQNSDWEVYLDFDKTDVDKTCRFSLLIAEENGILDNKQPWYLFVWKGEEGGERYKFSR